jgi:2-oxoisovalerate dehydrogenase E1 component
MSSVIDTRTTDIGTLKDAIGEGRITREDVADWLRTMCEVRAFEEKVMDLLGQDIIKGASHLSAGQEAVAVGALAAIRRGDVIASTHRGHGHCGAAGNKYAEGEAEHQEHWNLMMAELMGKETGYCRGRGGSMHIADVAKCNNLGSTGIVGGNIPLAVGAALAEKYLSTGAVVLCFFGDGATNTGSFHESMNMAATLGLPLVAIIENNLYGMSVPFSGSPVEGTARATNIQDAALRALAYDVPGVIVDGQDVLAVFRAVSDAVVRARAGEGMTLIEAKTYRWYGHSRSDPRAYRTREEEAQWKARDPIGVLCQHMVKEGLFSGEEVEALIAKGKATIEEATRFAQGSPWPDPAAVAEDVVLPLDHTAAEASAEAALAERVREAQAVLDEALAGRGRRSQREVVEAVGKGIAAEYGMEVLTIAQAVASAQAEEMRRDRRVIVLGEDVGLYGGAYGATRGLLAEFGMERIIDTAISEAAICGAATGAALRGLRPVAEIMYVDFITLALDQLVHNAAYNRYMFGGKTTVPMVLRTEGGVGRSIACHHSESLEAWLVHVPGLLVVMPSTPYEAKGLLRAAIRSPNPVVFIEHKATYGQVGPVPRGEYLIPLGVASVKRPGTDVTLVAYSRMVTVALEAAKLLGAEGVSAEVIDLRTLKPLDVATVAESVKKTGRLVTVSEGFPHCGVGREVTAQVMEYEFADGRRGFDCLDARPVNLAALDVPPPMSEPLEEASIPSVDGVVKAVRSLL